MRRKAKNVLSLVTATIMAFSVMLATGVSAFAQSPKDIWYVGDYSETHSWKGSSNFSVDTNTYYKDSRYSIKISNTEKYDYGIVSKTFVLEPFTTYKFSAMVKYEDFELSPDAKDNNTGARLVVNSFFDGVFYRVVRSSASNSKEWTKLECTFRTNGEKDHEYYLRLLNGNTEAKCKGTAWFSDIKLEKAKTTNQWNVLAIIFPTVETDVDLHGKKTVLQPDGDGLTHYKATLTDEEIEGIHYTTDKLKKSFAEVSGNLVNVCNIDYVIADMAATEVIARTDNKGYSLNLDAEAVTKIIDKYSLQKTYQQIIVFSPMSGICGGWWGLGGSKYKGINRCQITCDKSTAITREKDKSFIEGLLIHEILHGVDVDSKVYDPTTPDLHDNTTIYQEQYPHDRVDNNKTYYTDYMRHNLPDGRGVDPRAYYRLSGEYTLVSNDMTSGGLIEQSSALPLKLSTKMVEKISKQSYTGKAVKPAVQLKDGRYTLKNGVDYTVSYENNKKVGTATATITGKGLYEGVVKTEFSIVNNGSNILYDFDGKDGFTLADVVFALDEYLAGKTDAKYDINGKDGFTLDDVVELLDLFLAI